MGNIVNETIYNPALVSPFLATLNYYAVDQRHKIVFIVMELGDKRDPAPLGKSVRVADLESGLGRYSEECVVDPVYVPSARRLSDERFHGQFGKSEEVHSL